VRTLERFYTCKEVSERYGVTVPTVREWIKNNNLCAVISGKNYRIKESDLLNFESRKTKK